MNIIIAHVKLNMKVLRLDILPFIWSLVFPALFLLVNKDMLRQPLDLRYFWVYIIITAYIFGVGVSLLTSREAGFLKFAFALTNEPLKFLAAQIITQYIYILTYLTVFNLFAIGLLQVNFFSLMLHAFCLMLLLTPVALLSYGLLLIKRQSVGSVNTIINIILFILFLSMPYVDVYYAYHPFIFLADLLVFTSAYQVMIYGLVLVLSLLLMLYTTKHLDITSIERR